MSVPAVRVAPLAWPANLFPPNSASQQPQPLPQSKPELTLFSPPAGAFDIPALAALSQSFTQRFPARHRASGPEGVPNENLQYLGVRIPWDRVDEFLAGERKRSGSSFYIKRSQVVPEKQIHKVTYHCSHGPEDFSHGDPGVRDETQAPRPGKRRRRGKKENKQSIKHGCQAQFTLERQGSLAEVRWQPRRVQHSGHGDIAAFISQETREWVRARVRAGLKASEILTEHRKNILDRAPLAQLRLHPQLHRDYQLNMQDIANITNKIKMEDRLTVK